MSYIPHPPRRSEPAEEKPRFAEQAAKFSLYAPIAAVLVGFCLNANPDVDRSTKLALGGLNLLLIAAGFVMGLVALALARRQGAQGVVGRAIGGVILNGAALALALWLLFFVPWVPSKLPDKSAAKLPGTWVMRLPAKAPVQGTMELELKADGGFRLAVKGDQGQGGVQSGTWRLDGRVIVFDVRQIEGGDQSKVGQTVRMGAVIRVDDQTLVVRSKEGDETFHRK